jgi:hypothetical protein
MPIEISPLKEADIPGAIDSIQQAFANDPYNLWVYSDRDKVSSIRHSFENGRAWHCVSFSYKHAFVSTSRFLRESASFKAHSAS